MSFEGFFLSIFNSTRRTYVLLHPRVVLFCPFCASGLWRYVCCFSFEVSGTQFSHPSPALGRTFSPLNYKGGGSPPDETSRGMTTSMGAIFYKSRSPRLRAAQASISPFLPVGDFSPPREYRSRFPFAPPGHNRPPSLRLSRDNTDRPRWPGVPPRLL